MEMELLSTQGANDESNNEDALVVVGIQLYSIGNFSTNVDVEWYDVDISPKASMWRRGGRTRQNEDGSVPGSLHIAWVSTPVPPSVQLTSGNPIYFFGVGESNITDPPHNHTVGAPSDHNTRGKSPHVGAAAKLTGRSTITKSTPMQRAVDSMAALIAMSARDKSQLSAQHAEAWEGLWSLATIEMDTNRTDIARAVNATLYGMLSLHDETDTVGHSTHSLTHLLIHSCTHSLTHSLTRPAMIIY